MTQKTVRVIISGRVQGVGYRAWVEQTALKSGLTGWVRNLREGTVEAVFCGEEGSILYMLNQCKKGPMLARVTGIEEFPSDERADDFICKPTV